VNALARTWRRLLVAQVLLCSARAASADEFKPAYLQLVQVDSVTYDVLWKLPALDEATPLALAPVFPTGTVRLTPVRGLYAAGTVAQRWRVRIPGGLDGNAVEFPALPTTRIDVLVRLSRADGSVQLQRVLSVSPRFVVKPGPGRLEVVATYTVLGIEHILTGFDHLLFVLALVILVAGVRRLVATITAFTVAHSMSLALATLGVVHVPGPPVEATIALSIVFVAGEIIQGERGRGGLAARAPWLVAFSFGLLHGLGFAGALAEVGLPHNAIPLALLCFNVGVEIGQLVFVTAVLLVAWVARRASVAPLGRRRWATASAYLIGALASYWLIERLAKFWA